MRSTGPLLEATELQEQVEGPQGHPPRNTERRGQQRGIMVHLLNQGRWRRSTAPLGRTTGHQGRDLEELEEDLEVLGKSTAPLERTTSHLRATHKEVKETKEVKEATPLLRNTELQEKALEDLGLLGKNMGLLTQDMGLLGKNMEHPGRSMGHLGKNMVHLVRIMESRGRRGRREAQEVLARATSDPPMATAVVSGERRSWGGMVRRGLVVRRSSVVTGREGRTT